MLLLINNNKILIVLLCCLAISNLFSQTGANVLRYNRPAEVWTEALPMGNGYMGGMIFGDPYKEHIQLNESTLYSGDPNHKYENYNIREDYNEIMALFEQGKYSEGQEMVQKMVGPCPRYVPTDERPLDRNGSYRRGDRL